MLEIKRVKKKYHSRTILEIDRLQLEQGIYQLKGANGAGKTTLLKMIAGLLPFEGDIICQGISQKKSPALYRRQISWAEAEPLYPSFLSGSDLLSLYRSVFRVSKDVTEELISFLMMSDFIHEPVGSYSAGMTKKLSLLLAFTSHPSIYLLDEPFITLDESSTRSIHDLILQKHHNTGAIFILSSHQETGAVPFDTSSNLKIINQQISVELPR
jgi:ABC-2 type transport system ATP-binding protein